MWTIYCLYHNGELVYVGCTVDLSRRQRQWQAKNDALGKRGLRLSDVSVSLLCTCKTRVEARSIEGELIARLSPPWNSALRRRAKRQVFRRAWEHRPKTGSLDAIMAQT